jgi:deoxyadenosine/deoxycytidine kinase
MSINYKIVSIEGNIGSGKSTLLENLRKQYANHTHIIFLPEPVDDWEKIKDNEGNTMLKKFYANQEKYSFAFQIMAYISRLKILHLFTFQTPI